MQTLRTPSFHTCLSRVTRLRGKNYQSLISYLSVVFKIQSAVDQSLSVFHDQSAIDQSAVDKSAVCWSTGQQTGGKYCSTVPPGAPIYHQPAVVSQLGVVLKINEISMNFQYTSKSPKWSPQTSKSVQNEVPGGT